MKQIGSSTIRYGVFISVIVLVFTACERNSSPEGRMSIKLESHQKEMMEKMHQQNKAILDSLGKIREELNEIKKQRN